MIRNIKIITDFDEQTVGNSLLIIPKINQIPDYSKCVFLDGCAFEIWDMLKRNNSRDEIYKNMCSKYIVDENIISEDIDNIITTLYEAKIIDKC